MRNAKKRNWPGRICLKFKTVARVMSLGSGIANSKIDDATSGVVNDFLSKALYQLILKTNQRACC